MKLQTVLLVFVVLLLGTAETWARGGGGVGGSARGGGVAVHSGSGLARGGFRNGGVGVSDGHTTAGFSNPFLANRFMPIVTARQASVRVFRGAVFFPHSHFFGPGISIVDVPTFDITTTTVTTYDAPDSGWAPPSGTAGVPRDPRIRSTTQLAPFDPTSQELVYRMLTLAGIKKGDVVYDLGAGDGRMVIAAAKKYGVKAVGYEIDPGLVKLARENVRKQGVEKLVEIRQQDFMKANLSPATIVTLYLSYDGNLAVRSRLMNQLRPGARVVSYTFDMGDWAPKITEAYRDAGGDTHLLYYWEISSPEMYGISSVTGGGSSQQLSFVTAD